MADVHHLPIWIFNKKFRLEERIWRVTAQKEERISIILIIYNEKDKHYFILFKDGQGALHKLEISRALYDTFDSFELDDLVYLNVVDRHIEQSEVWEATLNVRAVEKPESIEEVVLKKIQIEALHTAMKTLPEMQRRRMQLYYFEGMTYEQIAKKEGCTKMPVKRSIEAAVECLKKELKKI